MLTLTIPEMELFDSQKNEFTNVEEFTIVLEHSLVSVSKWESRWCKPFLGNSKKTPDETIDYVRCMIIESSGPEPSEITLAHIPNESMLIISKYIDAPMTATTLPEDNKKTGGREIITNELIYYWMITQQIPIECQSWHLNRLLTLINVCVIKNTPPKKRNKRDILSRNASLNAARRKALKSNG